MAHEILVGTRGNARFIDSRGPAWHRLVTDGWEYGTEVTATEGLAIIKAPEISVMDAPPLDVPGIGVLNPNTRYIIRSATDDLDAAVLGRVSPGYHLVGPREFCKVLDGAVGRTVETMGMLKEGAILFVTFELPEFDVNGDEHQNYLLVSNGMSGQDALKAVNSPVRTVCMNTLRLAEGMASETYVVPHTESAMKELGSYLVDLYQRALARGEAIKEALEVLASYRPTADEAERIVAATYPLPKRPSDFGPKLIVEAREKRFEHKLTFAQGNRESVMAMWQGEATGADTEAFKGTLFGLYNSTVEWEDYRQHHNTTEVGAGESALVGRRADIKARSFEACARMAGITSIRDADHLERSARALKK